MRGNVLEQHVAPITVLFRQAGELHEGGDPHLQPLDLSSASIHQLPQNFFFTNQEDSRCTLAKCEPIRNVRDAGEVEEGVDEDGNAEEEREGAEDDAGGVEAVADAGPLLPGEVLGAFGGKGLGRDGSRGLGWHCGGVGE